MNKKLTTQDMTQAIFDTPNLGPIKISLLVIKYFSKACGISMREALIFAKNILESTDIEEIHVPSEVALVMANKGENPHALEFWVHLDSSKIFLVKPQKNYKLVEMATIMT